MNPETAVTRNRGHFNQELFAVLILRVLKFSGFRWFINLFVTFL